MSNGENKSHVTLKRLELRKILEIYSKETIGFTTKMMFHQKSADDKKQMEELKKKTERVKFAIRRIKNMIDTDNLKEEINRLF
jgi:predicted RNA-binding protein